MLPRPVVRKAIVIGAVSRETGTVVGREISDTTRETLQGFVDEDAQEGAAVYTDGHRRYAGPDKKGNRRHGRFRHSVGEYVKGGAGTNRMESFWALPRRTYSGAWHHVRKKYLKTCILEAAFRHHMRDLDVGRRMSNLLADMVGQRLRHADLIACEGGNRMTRTGVT